MPRETLTRDVNLIVEDLNNNTLVGHQSLAPTGGHADSCSPMSIPGEYEDTPRYLLFIQNASHKLGGGGIDGGVYRVITKEQEEVEFGNFEDGCLIDKESLAVPTSPIESLKIQEMSSRLAILAKKFSLGKQVIKEMKKKNKREKRANKRASRNAE